MRAAFLYGPRDLRIEDIPAPVPGPGEVIVQIVAATTCGTDVKMFRQGHPSIDRYPVRFGHELSGRVLSMGEGVSGFLEGDEVFCANSAPCGICFQCIRGRFSLCEDLLYLLGGFGEQVLVPARIVRNNLHHLPSGLELNLAPIAEPLACAMHAVDRAGIEIGDTVAIVGGGSLGLMLCALVKKAGGLSLLLDPHDENLELARTFGAEEVIKAERAPADVEVVRSLTSGRGADQVFEAVGTPESWVLAAAMARPGGSVNFFGGCAAGTTVTIPTARLHYEEVQLRATYHHTPRHVRSALQVLARRDVPWKRLIGAGIRLERLEEVLSGRPSRAPSKHLVVPGGLQ